MMIVASLRWRCGQGNFDCKAGRIFLLTGIRAVAGA
jgi:hypothetical protein